MPRSSAFQPCQNFPIIPITFWVIGVLSDSGGLAPIFWWYKNKGGYIWTSPLPDLIDQSSRKYFFLKGMNLTKTLISFFFCGSIFGFFMAKNVKKRWFTPQYYMHTLLVLYKILKVCDTNHCTESCFLWWKV